MWDAPLAGPPIRPSIGQGRLGPRQLQEFQLTAALWADSWQAASQTSVDEGQGRDQQPLRGQAGVIQDRTRLLIVGGDFAFAVDIKDGVALQGKEILRLVYWWTLPPADPAASVVEKWVDYLGRQVDLEDTGRVLRL